MKFIVYTATAPNGRKYVGVTKNFKRRMKEHGYSKYPFGHALRKYGKENFSFEFEFFETVEEALNREAELIGPEEVKSKEYYNCCLGGALTNTLMNDNPMFKREVLENHPNLWTTESNPMNNPESKAKMIQSQGRKPVSVEGTVYWGVREAARNLGISRQLAVYRLRSKNFTDWFYV